MKTIVVMHHGGRQETAIAARICAQVRHLLDPREYTVVRPTERDWKTTEHTQLHDALATAEGVIVVVGPEGLDAGFENLALASVKQQIKQRGAAFGRLLILLPDVEAAPDLFEGWATEQVEAADVEYKTIAEIILKRLGVEPAWSDNLDLESAIGAVNPAVRQIVKPHLEKVARALSTGEPITFFVGPYASTGADDHDDVPRRVRAALAELIDDEDLRSRAPALWQDYLATLCLIEGRDKDVVAETINELIGALPGDRDGGESVGVFNALALLITRLRARAPKKVTKTAVTIISVCPGLRIERAMVAAELAFDRVTFPFRGGRASQEVARFTPDEYLAGRARVGAFGFMPEGEEPRADEPPFVRLLKIGGSLDRSPPAGDLAQMFELVSMQSEIAQFVSPAKMGPYIMLGGGLATPPVRAAHAVLLRDALRGTDWSQIALVPSSGETSDPWLRSERGHESALSKIGNHDRLRVLPTSPTEFVAALNIAFGG
jgi:hypothetical protein